MRSADQNDRPGGPVPPSQRDGAARSNRAATGNRLEPGDAQWLQDGFIPNQAVAWRSVPGSRIENAGCVRFDRNPDGGTRITVHMTYNPPAGVVGRVVASLFGHDPKREIDDDFVRLKSLIEFGKTRAHGETVLRDQLQTAPTA